MMMSDESANPASRRGFTLLELLLVLVLIGISAATIVPHLNGTLGRWQLRETARNLQTTLQLASQWACARQEGVVFALNTQKSCFCLKLLKNGSSTGGDLLPTGRQSFGQGVTITRTEGFESDGTEKVLVFHPDGSSCKAIIVLTGSRPDANRDTLWQISVDGGGAVQCQEKSTDEPDE